MWTIASSGRHPRWRPHCRRKLNATSHVSAARPVNHQVLTRAGIKGLAIVVGPLLVSRRGHANQHGEHVEARASTGVGAAATGADFAWILCHSWGEINGTRDVGGAATTSLSSRHGRGQSLFQNWLLAVVEYLYSRRCRCTSHGAAQTPLLVFGRSTIAARLVG